MTEIEKEVSEAMAENPNYPLGEPDAMKWAVAWRLTRDRNGINANTSNAPGEDIDGWMVGWFANCMASALPEMLMQRSTRPAMTEATELKPCPLVPIGWCKGGKITTYEGDSRFPAYARCESCRTTKMGATEAEAILAWNTHQLSVPVQGEPVANLEFNTLEVAIAEGLILHCDMDEDRDSARIEQVSTAIAKRVREAVLDAPTERERVSVVPEDYASIKSQLGHIIPCYDDPTGCILDDGENEKRCGEGCFILSVYRSAAIAQAQEAQ